MDDTGRIQPSPFATNSTQSQSTSVVNTVYQPSNAPKVQFIQEPSGVVPTLSDLLPPQYRFSLPKMETPDLGPVVGGLLSRLFHPDESKASTTTSPNTLKTPSKPTRSLPTGDIHVTEANQEELDKIQGLKKGKDKENSESTGSSVIPKKSSSSNTTTSSSTRVPNTRESMWRGQKPPFTPIQTALLDLAKNRRIGIGPFAISGLNLQHLLNGLNNDPQKILGAFKTFGNTLDTYKATKVFQTLYPPGSLKQPTSTSMPPKVRDLFPNIPDQHYDLKTWVHKIDPTINFDIIQALSPAEIGKAILKDFTQNRDLKPNYSGVSVVDPQYPSNLLYPDASQAEVEKAIDILFDDSKHLLTGQQQRAVWFGDIMGLQVDEGGALLGVSPSAFNEARLAAGKWIKQAVSDSEIKFQPTESSQKYLLSYVKDLVHPLVSTPSTSTAIQSAHHDDEEESPELSPTAKSLQIELTSLDPKYNNQPNLFLQNLLKNKNVKDVIVSGDKASYRWDGQEFAAWLRNLRSKTNQRARYFSGLLENLGRLVGSRNPTLKLVDGQGNLLVGDKGVQLKPFTLFDYLSIMDSDWSQDRKEQLEKKLDAMIQQPKSHLFADIKSGIGQGITLPKSDKKNPESVFPTIVGPVELFGPFDLATGNNGTSAR